MKGEYMMSTIDLRSDTVTKPTDEMRKAMAEAKVGDDVYGEDPTVIELEQLAAEITGHEAALFVCSGTMGNLVSLLTHCNRGEGVILGFKSHIYNNEGGGLSALGGLVPLCVNDDQGVPDHNEILSYCRDENVHYAPAKLLCLENTHNACGGNFTLQQLFAFLIKHDRLLYWDAMLLYRQTNYAETKQAPPPLLRSAGQASPYSSGFQGSCRSTYALDSSAKWFASHFGCSSMVQ